MGHDPMYDEFAKLASGKARQREREALHEQKKQAALAQEAYVARREVPFCAQFCR